MVKNEISFSHFQCKKQVALTSFYLKRVLELINFRNIPFSAQNRHFINLTLCYQYDIIVIA